MVAHRPLSALDVVPGEIIGVVGGSGSGKSVLMRSVIGLQTPTEGEITVFGEPMRSMRPKRWMAAATTRLATSAGV